VTPLLPETRLLLRLLAVLEAAGELPPTGEAWLWRCLEAYRGLAARAEKVTLRLHRGDGASEELVVQCLPARGRLDRARELGLLVEKKPGDLCVVYPGQQLAEALEEIAAGRGLPGLKPGSI